MKSIFKFSQRRSVISILTSIVTFVVTFGLFQQVGKAKVRDLGREVVGEQDVSRGEVTVDDLLLLEKLEPFGDLPKQRLRVNHAFFGLFGSLISLLGGSKRA